MSDLPQPARILKPTLSTQYHIDYDWWGRNDREWRVYLLSHLCSDHRTALESVEAGEMIDWVEEETGEVRPVDGVQHALIIHCAKQPEYLTPHTSLVDAVFRIFLANGNSPLTLTELAERTGRPAATILRTLGGARVYKGLRPNNV